VDDVTMCIKTFDRYECVRKLIFSIRRYLGVIPILVADDSAQKQDIAVAGVEHIKLPYDVGLSVGRNVMVDRVKTPYLMILDDDFVFSGETDPEKLKRPIVEDGFDIVGGQTVKRKRKRVYACCFERKGPDLIRHKGKFKSVSPCGCKEVDAVENFFMARTEIFRTVRWDEDLKVGEHLWFFLNVQKAGFKVGYVPEVTVVHDPKRTKHYRQMRLRSKQFARIGHERYGVRKLIDKPEAKQRQRRRRK